ncbi:hypothetical protein [Gaoshiqia sediminis]|uniref:Uncharacterized protein n=1 Tax=Gaoshiqia sediminis TaxID=2986998 RepID=A0AA41Y9W0_9BACT|nr:hypothetical protein [Gaoshiqia sediminis]MCW0484635.1 hypothetical protein [Gaoshiqia sediminis]
MNSVKVEIPIHLQFVEFVEKAFDLLDTEAQQKVRQFVIGQQHPGGAFVDRGGTPDLYYSLFGFWLASALKMKDQLMLLQKYTSARSVDEERNLINKFALVLIRQGLSGKKKLPPTFFRFFLKRDYQVNFSYQLFLFLLVFDARYGRKSWLYFVARVVLGMYRLPIGAPCSMLAALLVARHEVGLKTVKLQKRIMAYFDEANGFKAFEQMDSGDMLSTGVALFALQKTGFDIRLLAPACLGMIQDNFVEGAFLSGDGDPTRDLEYTFYGLLALGSIAGQENRE